MKCCAQIRLMRKSHSVHIKCARFKDALVNQIHLIWQCAPSLQTSFAQSNIRDYLYKRLPKWLGMWMKICRCISAEKHICLVWLKSHCKLIVENCNAGQLDKSICGQCLRCVYHQWIEFCLSGHMVDVLYGLHYLLLVFDQKNHEIDGNVILWRKLCVVDHSVRASMKSAAKCVN